MYLPVEIHLQEGFRGDRVVVHLDDVVRAKLTPRTRLQTGLAQIERLDARVGQTVRIDLPDRDITIEHHLRANDHYLVVCLVGNALKVSGVPDAPGYV